jgi:hypothetical protein
MFPDLPLQEMFNKVVKHLLKQGARSMRPGMKQCAYRGMDGKRCAVGALIPDSVYSTKMEGGSVKTLSTVYPDLFQFDGFQLELLTHLQLLHDCSKPALWREGLANLARDYKLEMPSD